MSRSCPTSESLYTTILWQYVFLERVRTITSGKIYDKMDGHAVTQRKGEMRRVHPPCAFRGSRLIFSTLKLIISRDTYQTKQRVHLDIRAYRISLADGYKCSYRCSSITVILNTHLSCKKVSKHSTRYASF